MTHTHREAQQEDVSTGFDIDIPPSSRDNASTGEVSIHTRDTHADIAIAMEAGTHPDAKQRELAHTIRTMRDISGERIMPNGETVFHALTRRMADKKDPLHAAGCTMQDIMTAMNAAGYPMWRRTDSPPPSYQPLCNDKIGVGNDLVCAWLNVDDAKKSPRGRMIGQLQTVIDRFNDRWDARFTRLKKGSTGTQVAFTEDKATDLKRLYDALLEMARTIVTRSRRAPSGITEPEREPSPLTEPQASELARALLRENGYIVESTRKNGTVITDKRRGDVFQDMTDAA